MTGKPLLEIVGLTKSFPIRNGFGRQTGEVKAVDGISFTIDRGEVYGLAGESGSGKSTIARMIMGLTRPSGGDILLDGHNITGTTGTRAYGRKVQMVFQNPGSSLNPRRTVGKSIAVPLDAHGLLRRFWDRLPNIHHSAQDLSSCPSTQVFPMLPKSGLLRLATVSIATTMLLAPLGVQAAEDSAPISVKVNMARILRISAPAATVIIGNPGVADVTIQDPQTLVLTGKSYGQTNMIVLDAKGNPIADTLLEVVQSQPNLVTMLNGGQRNTMTCNPTCQPIVMLGDSAGYSSELVQSMGIVQGMAQ